MLRFVATLYGPGLCETRHFSAPDRDSAERQAQEACEPKWRDVPLVGVTYELQEVK